MPKVTIEKMIYGGDGLGRLRVLWQAQSRRWPGARNPAAGTHGQQRGKAVFVPFVLEDEAVDVEIIEQRTGFARGKAVHCFQPRLSASNPAVRILAAAAAASISTPATRINWR